VRNALRQRDASELSMSRKLPSTRAASYRDTARGAKGAERSQRVRFERFGNIRWNPCHESKRQWIPPRGGKGDNDDTSGDITANRDAKQRNLNSRRAPRGIDTEAVREILFNRPPQIRITPSFIQSSAPDPEGHRFPLSSSFFLLLFSYDDRDNNGATSWMTLR